MKTKTGIRSKVHYAVAAILSGLPAGALMAQTAAGQSATDVTGSADSSNTSQPLALGEVVVTATRRSENVQNVPVTVQVLTEQQIQQLHISSFEDYVKLVPNLTSADSGPGLNEIVIRGIGAGTLSTQLSATGGQWPNVGVYLDDQSVQFPGQNMDVYAIDLARIEVLEGPQGTLFGSGAEAGAIRYITNKPKLDVVEGSASGDYSATAHGDPNTAVTGVLNLPVVDGHMAVRLAAYTSRQGGYIDNVPGTFARKNTDTGINYANYPAVNGVCPDGKANNGYCVPPGSPTVSNSSLVRNNFNPVTYNGGRVEALYKFDDDWSFLVTQLYQNMDAEGVFYQNPIGADGQALQPLEVQLYSPTYHTSKDSNTTWTLTGKGGPLNLIYAGGLLTRKLESQYDYTTYSGGFSDYYQCFGPGRGSNALTSTCFSPATVTHSKQTARHWQHEFRVETPSDWRLRGTVGVYAENNIIFDTTQEDYKTIPACTSDGPAGSPGNTGCMSNVGTFSGSTANSPGVQADNVAFDIDTRRQETQIAEYGSVSFDLTPRLTLTAGTRHFIFQNNLRGNVLSGVGCFEGGTPAGGCQGPYSFNLDQRNLSDTEGGWRSQANLSYRMEPELFGSQQRIMTYATFSQGFRPGSFNRTGGAAHGPGPDGINQFLVPTSYAPDTLNNYEIGFKSDWHLWNRTFQWNASAYREDWKNSQVTFFYPELVGNVFFNVNGQDYRIKGLETSLVAQIWDGLTFRGAGSWNNSEQVNSPQLLNNNPASPSYGQPITQVCPTGPASCVPVTGVFGARGAPSSNSPPIHYTLSLRYDHAIGAFLGTALQDSVAYVQFSMQHQGHSFTQPGVSGLDITNPRHNYENPAYSLFDAAIGISKNGWGLDIYGRNLADSNTAVFTSSYSFITDQTVLRPRTLGVTIHYNF